MAVNNGINFRATSGFVTDGTDETFCLEADNYSVTRGGITFGWEAGSNQSARNRNAALDRRLAGTHFVNNSGTGQHDFRFDLDNAVEHDVVAAFGDVNSSSPNYINLLDTTTSYKIIDEAGGHGSNEWWDANGVLRTSESDWVNNNVSISRVFTTTIARFRLGTPTDETGFSDVAHIRLDEVAAAPFLPFFAKKDNVLLKM